jgi:short-subunit dehydrogenase
MRIDGAVAIVTGASSGIGEDVALELARRGATVWAVARSDGPLNELAARQSGIRVYAADLTDESSRTAMMGAIGPVDILVNNAGVGYNGLVEDMPRESVRQLFELNVIALIDLTQLALPGMLERRRGHIVNIASVASWVATPPLTVYSSTKFAVQGFTDGLRREMFGRGVAVTSINPGPVATRFFARAGSDAGRRTDEMGTDQNPGVPASMVTSEIITAIQVNGLPPYDVVAVPRALGASRLTSLPGASLVVDAASMVSRMFANRRPPG